MIDKIPKYSKNVLFDENPIPLLMIELNSHHIIKTNKSAVEKFGFSKAELQQMDLSDLRHKEDRHVIPIPSWDIKHGHYLETTCRCLTKDLRSLNITFLARLIEYKHEKVAFSIIHDITPHRFIESLISEAQKEVLEEFKESISQELHDGLIQTLVASQIHFNGVYKDLQIEDDQTTYKFKKALELLTQGITEVRDISHQIMPKSVRDFPLSSLLDKLLSEFNSDEAFEINYQYVLNDLRISEKQKVNIYRMIQEILSNIRKHAKATKIKISLNIARKKIVLIIEDNGVGFDLATFQKKAVGIGLTNLKKRTTTLNGILNVMSEVNEGTRIMVRLPIPTKPETNNDTFR